jgi:FkbH-like protein
MSYRVNTNLDLTFDEEWYLRQNADVATSVDVGGWRSGLEHFLTHGLAEGRLPTGTNGTAAPRPLKVTTPVISDEPPPTLMRFSEHAGIGYLVPPTLTRSPLTLRRVLLIGSCFLRQWDFQNSNIATCPVDFFLVNNAAELPARSREEALQYDCQIIQIPLRAIIDDLMLWRLPYDDRAGHEAAFRTACDRLEFQLGLWLKYNTDYSLLTFVTNFFQTQENAVGRLVPKYDLRNPAYFINKLNEYLEHLLSSLRNIYLLDTDKIAASVGRRYVQDDSIAITAHGGLMPHAGTVTDRIESLDPMASYYDIRWPQEYTAAVWAEFTAMIRTLRQLDAVKMVVVDLDDTLWTGVSGDMPEVSPFMVEGWPLGLIEALLYLKKRGVLLAVISKNDENRIRQIWDDIFFKRLTLDDFATVRINWQSKSENMREIIEVVNILPNSVVFVDDNPVERAEMQHVFPEMRIIGRDPYYLRRILLWAPETQVPSVSDESLRRTEMVQAQFAREDQRRVVSRAEFLAAAAPKVRLFNVPGVDHPRFNRTIELLNKTNQFNTTGKRWKLEECQELLHNGGTIWAFEVSDAFTNYGLVGVVIVRGNVVEQWVMSCRVLGYQIEEAVMAHIVKSITHGNPANVRGVLIETEANLACRDLFSRCGFEAFQDGWHLSAETPLDVPAHVAFSIS